MSPEVSPIQVNIINEDRLLDEFEKTIGNKIYFAFNSYALSSKSKDQLIKQANWLKEYPDINVNIEGYCDERGSIIYNLGLGYKRAKTVKEFLVQKGIDRERLILLSYGKDKPEIHGHNETAWKQNRRVVTHVTISALLQEYNGLKKLDRE